MAGVEMYELLRPIMRAWYATQIRAGAASPKPLDEPTFQARQSDADKVLLIGNGPLHGWGVLTHHLSITGHLAHETRAETARPCTVHYIGDETMTIASARAWVGTHDVSQYDAVVLVIGMNDAVRLTPLKAWEDHYRDLLAFLFSATKPGTRMVVVGMQPVRSITAFAGRLGRVAEFHAGRMNKILEDLTEDFSTGTYFVLPAPDLEPDLPLGSSCMYHAWARSIVTHLAPALDAARVTDPSRRKNLAPAEHGWSGTQTLIDNAAHGGSTELQRLAALAKDTFKVDMAGVSLVDGDRVWFAVNTAVLPRSVPAELVYCHTVVQQQTPLVVPDAQKDPRFQGNPFIDITGMDFYAGHPLTASNGKTIGTFCLFNANPRPEESISLEALRLLALQAEIELRRYETHPSMPVSEPSTQP